MNYLTVKQSLGKVSVILALSNILFSFFSVAIVRSFNYETFLVIWLFSSVALIFAGLITGAIGFFTKRAWVGLVLNILLAILIYLLIKALFSCCVDY